MRYEWTCPVACRTLLAGYHLFFKEHPACNMMSVTTRTSGQALPQARYLATVPGNGLFAMCTHSLTACCSLSCMVSCGDKTAAGYRSECLLADQR
jgi:hypothetical protein